MRTGCLITRRIILAFFLCSAAAVVYSQTTAFTYQGKLTDTGSSATGTYLMEFRLFDAVSSGTQVGSTISNPSVAVTIGIFTVQLDFNSPTPCPACFNGADRYLEVAVKKNAGDAFNVLGPRQKITSAPYAIKSVNAETLEGLTPGDFVLKGGGTMLGDLDMGTHKITGLAAPTAATDAVTKAYADASLLTPRWSTVSWASTTSHPAGAWSNIFPSMMSLTTTGKPLLITMNISLNQGSHGACRPIIDGVWAGSYGGLINPGDPFWQEGLIAVGAAGAGWARWSLNRIYPGVPAGNHTLQAQCATDGGTMQSCGSTIGCSFAAIELH